MNAIILAGGNIPPEDPLFAYTGGQQKAYLAVGNRPMINWVIDALVEADSITGIHIIGGNHRSNRTNRKTITTTEDQGGMLENIKAGFNQVLASDPKATHAVITSSDIPMINGSIVDWRVNSAKDQPLDYDFVIVDRTVMEQRFPGSDRSYLRVDRKDVCAADINIYGIRAIDDENFWREIISLRKSPLAQARFIGPSVLFRILLRRFTLNAAEEIVRNRLGLKGKVRFSPFAEIAMDMDKSH